MNLNNLPTDVTNIIKEYLSNELLIKTNSWFARRKIKVIPYLDIVRNRNPWVHYFEMRPPLFAWKEPFIIFKRVEKIEDKKWQELRSKTIDYT